MARANRYPNSFAFRLDHVTADQLRSMADAYGMPPAAFARHKMIELLQSSMRPPIQRRMIQSAEIREALYEVTKQGVNLNQIARVMNRDGATVEAQSALADLIALNEMALRALIAAIPSGPAL